jgi:ankyrin repeat protein
LACFKGDKQSVATILKHTQDITVSDSDGLNALHYAAQRGDMETLEYLFVRLNGLCPKGFANSRDQRGRNALHHLLMNPGVVDCANVQFLIDKGTNVNDLDDTGMSPLALYLSDDFVLLHDAPPVVRLIFESGSDPSFSIPERGLNLAHLHANSSRINTELLRVLAAGRVNLQAKDDDDRTVLHHCAIAGSLTTEAYRFLCDEAGLAKETLDVHGKTPQQYAAEMKKKERHPDIFDPNRWSRTKDILLDLI